MKKNILLSVMPALLFSAFSYADGAPEKIKVDGGRINFVGSVVAAPCAVDNDTDEQTVRLGQVSLNKLLAKGESSSAVPFNIKLSGCDLEIKDKTDPKASVSYTKASIKFSGITAGDSSTLALAGKDGAGADVAKNVGVEILQNNKAVIVDGTMETATTNLINGNNEIPFSAAYIATADGASPGAANATVSFSVTYE